jgi:hypothetical protein
VFWWTIIPLNTRTTKTIPKFAVAIGPNDHLNFLIDQAFVWETPTTLVTAIEVPPTIMMIRL